MRVFLRQMGMESRKGGQVVSGNGIRVNVLISEELHSQLKRICLEQDLSIKNAIRRLIEHWLDHPELLGRRPLTRRVTPAMIAAAMPRAPYGNHHPGARAYWLEIKPDNVNEESPWDPDFEVIENWRQGQKMGRTWEQAVANIEAECVEHEVQSWEAEEMTPEREAEYRRQWARECAEAGAVPVSRVST